MPQSIAIELGIVRGEENRVAEQEATIDTV
jgi:hypothetical protein